MLVSPRIAHHHHNVYLAVLTVDVSVPLKCQGATCVWQLVCGNLRNLSEASVIHLVYVGILYGCRQYNLQKWTKCLCVTILDNPTRLVACSHYHQPCIHHFHLMTLINYSYSLRNTLNGGSGGGIVL